MLKGALTMNLLTQMEQSISTLPDQYKNMNSDELNDLVSKIKQNLGDELFIPGHHYQKEEVMKFADARGDSLQLAQLSANTTAKYIVFCGVHFMAETADILSSDHQSVYLPDLRAGCSMADMLISNKLKWLGTN